MASDSMTSPRSSESSWWTPQQNKLFEKALVQFQTDTPDRWHNVAKAVGGGKCVEDVKLHYQNLLNDLWLIENDRFPVPNYWSTTGTGDCKSTEEQQTKKKKQN